MLPSLPLRLREGQGEGSLSRAGQGSGPSAGSKPTPSGAGTNAWQEGGQIITCFPWWSHLSFGVPGTPTATPTLPAPASIRRREAFPRVGDRLLGRRTRCVIRFDVVRGTTATHRFLGQAIGEAVCAPKARRTEEEACYVLTFATDLATPESRFIILDAEDFSADPVSIVKPPQRVPLGLHGNWCPSEA